MSDPPALRQAVLDASLALRISTGIGTVSTGLILLVSLVSLFEHRQELSFTNALHRWRFPLLLAATFSFCVFSLDGATVWRTWGAGDGCEYMSVAIPFCYVIEKQFLNLFLYDRAKMTHAALNLDATNERRLMLLRWLLWLTLVLGVPICFYWAAFLAFATKPLPEGECLFYATMPVVPVVFAIADAFLAIGMLIIFLVPLYEHGVDLQKRSSQRAGHDVFQKMVRRNVRLSLLAIGSGVIGLAALAASNWVFDGTPETEHLPIWGLFVISWDNLCSVLAVHGMSPKWLPKAVLRRVMGNPGATQGNKPVSSGTQSSRPPSKTRPDRVENEAFSSSSPPASPTLAPRAM